MRVVEDLMQVHDESDDHRATHWESDEVRTTPSARVCLCSCDVDSFRLLYNENY